MFHRVLYEKIIRKVLLLKPTMHWWVCQFTADNLFLKYCIMRAWTEVIFTRSPRTALYRSGIEFGPPRWEASTLERAIRTLHMLLLCGISTIPYTKSRGPPNKVNYVELSGLGTSPMQSHDVSLFTLAKKKHMNIWWILMFLLPAREADEPFRATRHTYIIYYQCSLGFSGKSEDCFIIHEEIQ